MHWEPILALVVASIGVIWRLSAAFSRLSVLEYEVKRLRAWRHKQATNMTTLMLETRARIGSLPEIDFEDEDSKVSESPMIRKPPK